MNKTQLQQENISHEEDIFEAELEYSAQCRMIEALLLSSPTPLTLKDLVSHLGSGVDYDRALKDLQAFYEPRGIQLVHIAGGYAFRTAVDLAPQLRHLSFEKKRISKAAMETLAIIAYHQPVTRAEIEDLRGGVRVSKGTLDVLLDAQWIEMKGRKQVLGKPLLFGTTSYFLDHFNLAQLSDLPGIEELRALGMLEGQVPMDFEHPHHDQTHISQSS